MADVYDLREPTWLQRLAVSSTLFSIENTKVWIADFSLFSRRLMYPRVNVRLFANSCSLQFDQPLTFGIIAPAKGCLPTRECLRALLSNTRLSQRRYRSVLSPTESCGSSESRLDEGVDRLDIGLSNASAPILEGPDLWRLGEHLRSSLASSWLIMPFSFGCIEYQREHELAADIN